MKSETRRNAQLFQVVRWFLLTASLCIVFAFRAGATTYVPVSDEALADRADAVALVSVVAIGPGPAGKAPTTEYTVEIEDVVRGDLPGSTLIVRVPGGTTPDGRGLRVWGAPAFALHEEALLFLAAASDGTYQVQDLLLGAFHVRTSAGEKLALRDLSEARQIDLHGAPARAAETARDLNRFMTWLGDREMDRSAPANYRVSAPADLRSTAAPFTTLTATDGRSPRWFTFDSRKNVRWYAHSAGQPGLDAGVVAESINTALAAWTNDPTSGVDYSYAGQTGATGGLRRTDRINTILFDDPGNEHVPGTFDCSQGGVLAIGAAYFYNSTRESRGKVYHEIFEADVVTNDGAGCFFSGNPQGFVEVLTHELGHTLGFGHSTDREAAMWAWAHNDGRGAKLGTDDRMAASAVYGDGSYQPDPETPETEAPGPGSFDLSGSPINKFSVRLSWSHTFSGVVGFRIERKQKDGSFDEVESLPADADRVNFGGLAKKTVYTFRIRAELDDGSFTEYSDEIGVRTKK
jgi:hypothetical protein